MARFVILAHDWPAPHLDLLVECDGVLKAWRLPLDFAPPLPCPAEANTDHRTFYLDYVGPVPGDRGFVSRWDAGRVVWEFADEVRAVVVFDGERLCGRWELSHEAGTAWTFRPAS